MLRSKRETRARVTLCGDADAQRRGLKKNTEVTGFLNVKSKDDSLLKKVELYLYVNGGREQYGSF